MLVCFVIMLAVVSGYTASKYVAVPLMASYRSSVEAEQGEGEAKDAAQPEGTEQQGTDGDTAEKAVKEEKEKTETGTNPEVVSGQQDIPSEPAKDKDISASAEVKELSGTETLSGLYCIQFGSFTTRNTADARISELAGKNISAFIKEKDGAFKVLSIPYETKEKAKEAAAAMGQIGDLFVVAV